MGDSGSGFDRGFAQAFVDKGWRTEASPGEVSERWQRFAADCLAGYPWDLEDYLNDLTMRTLPVFFGLLELLLTAGVTTVAEAAFQDRIWRPRLAPLLPLARLRIVHCVVDPDVAFERIVRRGAASAVRAAHADPGPADAADHVRRHRAFDRISVDAPWIEVDTTSGYRPGIDQVAAFINGS